MKLTKILVPLDGSSRAAIAIDTAIDLAAAPFSLVLLRAAEAHALPGVDPMEMQVNVVHEAEEYLASVKDDLAKRGIANVETSVWYGAPAHAIIEGARLQKVDLIVMSSHGRSGLGRLILGSVAESVLRGTTVPVCIVRAPGAPLEVPQGGATPGSGKAAVHV